MTPTTAITAEDSRVIKPYYETELGKLYHGDCLEIMPHIGPVDLVLTDPPYGDGETHQKHLASITLKNGEPAGQALGFAGLDQDSLVSLAETWVSISRRWVVFTCEWNFMHALNERGILVRFGIWRKPDGAPQFTGDRPGTGWEAIAICHRPGKKVWNGGGKHAFYSWPKGGNRSGHPTGNPPGLFMEFLDDFSMPGENILDPFLGSGTTAVACERLNRKWIGIEISEKYCEIAAKRIEAERKQLKLF